MEERNNKEIIRNDDSAGVMPGQWIISDLCTNRASRELYYLLIPRIPAWFMQHRHPQQRELSSEFMLGLNFKRVQFEAARFDAKSIGEFDSNRPSRRFYHPYANIYE